MSKFSHIFLSKLDISCEVQKEVCGTSIGSFKKGGSLSVGEHPISKHH